MKSKIIAFVLAALILASNAFGLDSKYQASQEKPKAATTQAETKKVKTSQKKMPCYKRNKRGVCVQLTKSRKTKLTNKTVTKNVYIPVGGLSEEDKRLLAESIKVQQQANEANLKLAEAVRNSRSQTLGKSDSFNPPKDFNHTVHVETGVNKFVEIDMNPAIMFDANGTLEFVPLDNFVKVDPTALGQLNVLATTPGTHIVHIKEGGKTKGMLTIQASYGWAWFINWLSTYWFWVALALLALWLLWRAARKFLTRKDLDDFYSSLVDSDEPIMRKFSSLVSTSSAAKQNFDKLAIAFQNFVEAQYKRDAENNEANFVAEDRVKTIESDREDPKIIFEPVEVIEVKSETSKIEVESIDSDPLQDGSSQTSVKPRVKVTEQILEPAANLTRKPTENERINESQDVVISSKDLEEETNTVVENPKKKNFIQKLFG